MRPLILACLGITWFVWGSTYLAIKFALASFPPFFQMGTRFLIAGILLMLWVCWRGHKLPTPVEWRNAAIVGALMLGGGMGGTAYAEQMVASGLVVAFIAITPALMTLASLPFGVRPTRLELVGISIGIAGVFLLIRGAGFAASPAGLISIVIACVAWSLGSVFSQHLFPLASSATGIASEMICGGVILMVLSLSVGEIFDWPPQPLAGAAWLYLIVFGSLISFYAYMVLLGNASPALASSYSFVNPLVAMLLGVSLGRETITTYEWLVAFAIVIGVTVLVLGRRR
jgi:drug/metabolite transporter (DMT)-like permease